MRVVSITPYPLWPNGAWKGMPSYYYFHKGLEVHGIDVVILHALVNSKDKIEDDCKVPREIWRIMPITYRAILKPVYIPLYIVASALRTRRYLNSLNADVILVGHTHLGALIAKLAKRRDDKIIGRFYGSLIAGKLGFDETMSVSKLDRVVEFVKSFDEFLALRLNYDSIIATNDGSGLNKIIKDLNNVHFLINGTEKRSLSRNQERDGLIRLGIGGRCIKWKNIDRHIDFLEYISDVVTDKQFIIYALFLVGHGEKEAFEDYSRRLVALSEKDNIRVELYSNLPNIEVKPVLSKLDFWLSFQDYLNISNFVIETRQMGIPSIVLNFGSTKTFFDTNELKKYCLNSNHKWMDLAIDLILDNYGTTITQSVMSVEERQNLDLEILESYL